MNFGEAIQAMKDGKRVYRRGWKNMWLKFNTDEPYITLVQNNTVPVSYWEYATDSKDLLAEDWEIKDEAPKANNDMKGLLHLSLMMFFFALENLHSEKEYSPFCGKNRD